MLFCCCVVVVVVVVVVEQTLWMWLSTVCSSNAFAKHQQTVRRQERQKYEVLREEKNDAEMEAFSKMDCCPFFSSSSRTNPNVGKSSKSTIDIEHHNTKS